MQFQIHSHGRWDVILQSELLFGPHPVEVVVFSFLACFVPLDSQYKFVKVCRALGFGVHCQWVQNWDGEPQPVHVGGVWLAKMQSYCMHDETIMGQMCKNAFD